MKLYLISQDVNDDYDTYDSAVVAAESEEEARKINPSGGELTEAGDCWVTYYGAKTDGGCFTSWAYKVDQVSVKYLGEAAEGTQSGVILASFNAG